MKKAGVIRIWHGGVSPLPLMYRTLKKPTEPKSRPVQAKLLPAYSTIRVFEYLNAKETCLLQNLFVS